MNTTAPTQGPTAAPADGPDWKEAPADGLAPKLAAMHAEALEAEAREGLNEPGAPAPAPAPEPEAPQVDPQLAESLALLFKTCCEVLAARLGDHWRIQGAEALALGQAWGAVIPADQVGPWTSVIVVSAGVFGPRLIEQRRIKERKAKTDRDSVDSRDRVIEGKSGSDDDRRD